MKEKKLKFWKNRKLLHWVLSSSVVVFILAISFMFLLSPSNSFKADSSPTATISVESAKTMLKQGETFTAKINVSGGGKKFTTFQADVAVENLTVMGLQEGPIAQWVTRPTTSSLNFFGGVIGDTANVTVYTLTLKAKSAGAASIHISNGSVKSSDGFSVFEILLSQNDGSFTIEKGNGNNQKNNAATATDNSTSSTSSTSLTDPAIGDISSDNSSAETSGTTTNQPATQQTSTTQTVSEPTKKTPLSGIVAGVFNKQPVYISLAAVAIIAFALGVVSAWLLLSRKGSGSSKVSNNLSEINNNKGGNGLIYSPFEPHSSDNFYNHVENNPRSQTDDLADEQGRAENAGLGQEQISGNSPATSQNSPAFEYGQDRYAKNSAQPTGPVNQPQVAQVANVTINSAPMQPNSAQNNPNQSSPANTQQAAAQPENQGNANNQAMQ